MQFRQNIILKRLDDRENAAERQAKRKGTTYQPSVKKEMRWGYWTKLKAEEALSHLKQVVFPSLVDLSPSGANSSFREYMKTAECKTFDKAGLPVLSGGSSSVLCVSRPEAEGLIEAFS